MKVIFLSLFSSPSLHKIVGPKDSKNSTILKYLYYLKMIVFYFEM